MNFSLRLVACGPLLTVVPLLWLSTSLANAQSSSKAPAGAPAARLETGNSLFQQNCAFCHGRDAGGGETGPDLTRSKLVASDVAGDKISSVIRNGVPDKGMPKFALPDEDIASLVAFIHDRKTKAESQKGGRRGVDAADLQTGNAAAGEAYFNGPGKCASCHSPTGDLAGVAKRHEGLSLEQRLLTPSSKKATVMVKLPSGETVKGTLAHRDEFSIALRDDAGRYRSWLTRNVKFQVEDPGEAHVQLLSQYKDSDIHNLMAYLQTLK